MKTYIKTTDSAYLKVPTSLGGNKENQENLEDSSLLEYGVL
jgi:hypothetical protein